MVVIVRTTCCWVRHNNRLALGLWGSASWRNHGISSRRAKLEIECSWKRVNRVGDTIPSSSRVISEEMSPVKTSEVSVSSTVSRDGENGTLALISCRDCVASKGSLVMSSFCLAFANISSRRCWRLFRCPMKWMNSRKNVCGIPSY